MEVIKEKEKEGKERGSGQRPRDGGEWEAAIQGLEL